MIQTQHYCCALFASPIDIGHMYSSHRRTWLLFGKFDGYCVILLGWRKLAYNLIQILSQIGRKFTELYEEVQQNYIPILKSEKWWNKLSVFLKISRALQKWAGWKSGEVELNRTFDYPQEPPSQLFRAMKVTLNGDVPILEEAIQEHSSPIVNKGYLQKDGEDINKSLHLYTSTNQLL